MEVGRRFGNQAGDAIAASTPDIRGDDAAQGFSVEGMMPPAAWAGQILSYVNGKKAGSFSSDPFFLPTQANRRVFLEFFLAGPWNGAEDVARYLRSIPGDRVQLDFGRRTIDQKRFRVYYTAGLTAAPDRIVASYGLGDRVTGSQTAAQFTFLSDVLRRGGHSFQIRPMDAAGNEKTGCTILTATLAPYPLPPTGVEVHAYSAAAGLVTLKWSQPADDVTGDVYHAYKSPSTGARVAYGTVVASATSPVAVTGTPSKRYTTLTLGVTGAAAAGPWVFGVRHKSGGVEEDNLSALARFVVSDLGRWSGDGFPFPPSFISVDQAPGGRLVVAIKHDNAGETNPTLRFRIYRSGGFVFFFDPTFFDPAFFLSATAGVNYATSVGVIPRVGSRFFEGTAGFVGLTEGTVYKFGVRSEATGFLREQNTHVVAANTPDATPPTSCPTGTTITKVLG